MTTHATPKSEAKSRKAALVEEGTALLGFVADDALTRDIRFVR
ncbi:MAG: hypothetical protein WD646_05210 [Actinomycetota bacterium]